MKKRPNKKVQNTESTEIAGVEPGATWSSLTGLRGMAALWVVLLHAYLTAGSEEKLWPPMVWLMEMGGMGVDIFFTLSAFLLSLPFADALRRDLPGPDLVHYSKRRFFRIFPAYYLQLALLLGYASAGLSFGLFWSTPHVGDVLAHGVLWLNAWPLVPAYLPIWWTLPVEFGFYLLLPWLAKCLTDKRWYWLLLGVALSLLYRHLMQGLGLTRMQEVYWVDHLPGRLFQFLIGMLGAYFFVRMRHRHQLLNPVSRNALIIFAASCLIALPALGYLVSDDAYLGAPTRVPLLAYWHFYASVCVTGLLIALCSGPNRADWFLQSMPMQWLGRISYGIYLWHYPVMILMREQFGGLHAARSDFLGFFISSCMITLALAFLSWHWLEAPILKRVGSSAAG